MNFTWKGMFAAGEWPRAFERSIHHAQSLDQADVRALVGQTCWAVHLLSQSPDPSNKAPVGNVVHVGLGNLGTLTPASPEHAAVRDALLESWKLLAPSDVGPPSSSSVVTHPADAGVLPLLVEAGVVIIIVTIPAVVVGGALYYGITKAAEVADREFKRHEDSRRMISAQSAAVKVVQEHRKREAQAHTVLPYSPTEKAIVSELRKTQKKVRERKEKDLGTGLGLMFGLGSASTLAAAAVGAYLLYKATE